MMIATVEQSGASSFDVGVNEWIKAGFTPRWDTYRVTASATGATYFSITLVKE